MEVEVGLEVRWESRILGRRPKRDVNMGRGDEMGCGSRSGSGKWEGGGRKGERERGNWKVLRSRYICKKKFTARYPIVSS